MDNDMVNAEDEGCEEIKPKTCDESVIPCPNPAIHAEYDGYKGYAIDNSIGMLIVWFFIIFVVTILALYALEPSFILKSGSDQIDNGKAMLTAFVFALFIVLLIFAVRWAAGKK